jgi:hypothetical protein
LPVRAAYAVGGSVSGLAGNGLRLEYDADNVSLPAALAFAANGSFVFDAATTSAITGTAYRIRILAQPTGPAQTCIVTGGTGTVASANVSSVQVVCDNHLVRINLTGMRDTNVIRLLNNGVDLIGVGAHTGPYQFTAPVATGDPYHVTIERQPSTPTQTCVVSNGSGVMGSSDVTVGIDCPYPPAYSVGGTISGLASATDKVSVLYGASNINFFIDRYLPNGPFSFTAAEGEPGRRHRLLGDDRVATGRPALRHRRRRRNGRCGRRHEHPHHLRRRLGGLDLHAARGAGTTHGSISRRKPGPRPGSPHLLPFDTSIYSSVTARALRGGSNRQEGDRHVNPGGSLLAQGKLARPVTFEPMVAGQAWASIRNLGGTLSLSHAVVAGGGDPLSTNVGLAGALQMQSPLATGGILHVDDVEIVGSLSQGVYVNGPIGFDASSRNLRVHGSAGFPGPCLRPRDRLGADRHVHRQRARRDRHLRNRRRGARRADDACARRAVSRRRHSPGRRPHGRRLAGRRPGGGADHRARL